VDEREVLDRERARLGAIVDDVQARLAALTEQIQSEGQTIVGSQGQQVLNPLLRSETSVRTELRRVSGDLSECEVRLAKLPRGPLDRTADYRTMDGSDWRAMPKDERLALWKSIPDADRGVVSEQVPGHILFNEFIQNPRRPAKKRKPPKSG
jgi:hypothetical protein